MTFRNLSSQGVISGAMRAGLEGRQIAVAYGRPVFKKSATLTAQVGTYLLFKCLDHRRYMCCRSRAGSPKTPLQPPALLSPRPVLLLSPSLAS